MQDLSRCALALKRVISEKRLDQIAKETGFCKRKRLLDASHTVWVFLVGLSACSGPRVLAEFVRIFASISGKKISYKPFHDRINKPEFAEFMRRILVEAMSGLSLPIMRPRDKILGRFDDILLHDGSSLSLPDALKKEYPGRFTKSKPAAMEIHATYSLFSGQAVSIDIAPDKEPERPFLPAASELSNKLLLIDNGYFGNAIFDDIDANGGFFICRAAMNFNPTIIKPLRNCVGNRVIGRKLRDIRLLRRNYDFIVESKATEGCKSRWRVTAFYSAKKNKHIFLITNLNARDFSANRVAETYRLRWQIELFFKECKSYTGLEAYPTKSIHIAEGLVWATMLTVLLRRYLAFSALRNKNKLPAFFAAAALGWTYMRDLAIASLNPAKRFLPVLRETLSLIERTSARSNPKRKDSFNSLGLEVHYGYA